MMRRSLLSAFALALFAMVSVLPTSVSASHGRYWNLTWEPDLTDPTNRTIIFHFKYVWATGFYPGDGVVGTVVTTDSLDYGDKSFAAPILTRILSVNAAQGWSYGEAVRLVSPGVYAEGMIYKYAANGNYIANVDSGNRWAGTANNISGWYRVETIVNAGSGNSPPVVSLPPIVQVKLGTVATFFIPAVDPNLDNITFRLSTSLEGASVGGFTQPIAFSVDKTTGMVTWDLTPAANPTVLAGDYWSAQIMVEDRDSSGVLKSKTPIDFLLNVVNPGANSSPVFEAPTPLVVAGPAGVPLSFIVQSSDINPGDTIGSLLALNPPSGMTVTPTAAGPSPNGNAKAVLCTWTPPTSGTTIIIFQSTDAPGGLTTFQAVTINGPIAVKKPMAVKLPEGDYAGCKGPVGMIGSSEGTFGLGARSLEVGIGRLRSPILKVPVESGPNRWRVLNVSYNQSNGGTDSTSNTGAALAVGAGLILAAGLVLAAKKSALLG